MIIFDDKLNLDSYLLPITLYNYSLNILPLPLLIFNMNFLKPLAGLNDLSLEKCHEQTPNGLNQRPERYRNIIKDFLSAY